VIGSLGITELMIIAGIALLIFGPRQLPKFGRSMGEMVKEFRGIGKEIEREIED
jgi:sec-independent protein translocase protein TatA